MDPDHEVTDKDIRNAFKARPQLRGPLRVAFYSFDPKKVKEIKKRLKKIEGVRTVYAIPSLFVTGRRPFQDPRSMNRPTKPPSAKKMRLLAARARCNVLMIFDYGHRIKRDLNWLSSFGFLLLPMLVLPHTSVTVDSYLTTYIMDVGNGYLYGQINASKRHRKRYTTIFSDWSKEKTLHAWKTMVSQTTARLKALIVEYQRKPEMDAVQRTAGATPPIAKPSGKRPR